MAIYLIQHGKSLPKEVNPERGLSDIGKAEIEKVAEIAKANAIKVSVIKHSGKKRALQTAEIFYSALEQVQGMEQMNGLNPLDDVKKIAENLENNNNTMYVGHLPFMEKLTSYLITGNEDKPVFKFKNGGIVCLDKDSYSKPWFIKWTLLPDLK